MDKVSCYRSPSGWGKPLLEEKAGRCGHQGQARAGPLSPTSHPQPASRPGGLQTSLTLPATLAIACSLPVDFPGGWAMDRGQGKALWARGGSQGPPGAARMEGDARVPPPSLAFHTWAGRMPPPPLCSRASPALPSMPTLVPWPLDFLRKTWVHCKGGSGRKGLAPAPMVIFQS